MWYEFTERSQKTIHGMAVRARENGHLGQTMQRLEDLVHRLETPPTEKEIQIVKMFNGASGYVVEDRSRRNFDPLHFLRDGPMAVHMN